MYWWIPFVYVWLDGGNEFDVWLNLGIDDSENENDLCPVAEPGTETDPGAGVPSSGGVQFV